MAAFAATKHCPQRGLQASAQVPPPPTSARAHHAAGRVSSGSAAAARGACGTTIGVAVPGGHPAMRDARCRAWQSSWRTQVLESSPTEQRSNGESYSKAADTAPFSSPLFSEDFVNSLRESLRRTPTVSEPAPRAEPEPAAASWRSASGNGNGNGSQSWRSASSSSRDTNAGSSNGNGNGSGAPAKTSFASWRSVAEAEVESPAAEPEAAGAPSGLRFNDSFKAALSSSSLMRGGPSAYSSGSDVSGADTQTEEEEEADEQAPAAAGLFTPAFKEALQSALARSPLYGTPLLDSVTPDSKYEQDVTPAPTNSVAGSLAGASPLFNDKFKAALAGTADRKQQQLDTFTAFGSDDDEVIAAPLRTATAYKPPPREREMSPSEEVLLSAVGSSQVTLQRLVAIKNEIDLAVQREAKQLERLHFAMTKAQGDAAYMATLQRMVDQSKRRNNN